MKAVVKVNEQLYGQTNISQPKNESLSEPVDSTENVTKGLNIPNNFILINEDKKLLRILPEEIQHVEAIKDYVKVYLENRVGHSKNWINCGLKKCPSPNTRSFTGASS
jgi:two-component system LytT family response regulator